MNIVPTKRNCQAIADALIVAHDLYKDESGKRVISIVAEQASIERDGIKSRVDWEREQYGLCGFVFHWAFQSGKSEGEPRPGIYAHCVLGGFRTILQEMYGSSDDPFKVYPGGSFRIPRISYKIRSREALKIAKYIERKHLIQ